MHIRQTLFSPLVKIREQFVVDSEQVQNRGVNIVDVDPVFHGLESVQTPLE